jgi:hypothetical protein
MGRPIASIVTVAHSLDLRIVGRAFHAAVPTAVVVRAVPVVFPVRLVVLPLIRNEVVEREPVMTRHKVDALLRLALLMRINLRAAQQPVGDVLDRARVAAKETAEIVAKPPVPFFPTVPGKAAHLVKPRCVPRLGDEFRARQ